MKPLCVCAALLLALAAPCAAAQDRDHPAASQQQEAAHQLHGVVNSVNAAAGRVNITHDPVASLKWPKMKMNFKVDDPALIEGLKPGTEVDFELRKVEGEYRITRITPAK